MKFLKKIPRQDLGNIAILILFLVAVMLGALIPNRQTQAANQETLAHRSAKLTKEAEKRVSALEKAPSDENLEKAEAALKKVLDKNKREAFQKRIELVKAVLATQAAAETAVKRLEDAPSQENVKLAQEAVDKVDDETLKEAFQARIAAVQEKLEAAKATTEATSSTNPSSTVGGETTASSSQTTPRTSNEGGTTYTPVPETANDASSATTPSTVSPPVVEEPADSTVTSTPPDTAGQD